VAMEETAKIPEVDIIIGNNDKNNVAQIVENYIANNVGPRR